jgi:RNA polymerase sigma-70 factor (ECF subfamily)
LKALEDRNLANPSDERLQVEAARQDPARFDQLYENNFERVYAYLARRTRDRDEAQDLTSEVFQQALAGLPRYQWCGLPFIAWLLGIAANVLADRWRRAGRLQEETVGDLEQMGVEEDVEQKAMLYQLVDSLPADQKQVILWRFVGRKSLREMATELGRSEGAIKQLQLRALQNLRERMS